MSLTYLMLKLKGGSGSGNWGHGGRLGKRGGSTPLSAGTHASDYKARRQVAIGITRVLKFGHNLGKEGLLGFDEEGNQINGFVKGSRSSVSDFELAINDATHVSVHNHPSSSSFSSGDIWVFANSKSKHMVVAGHDGTIYKMSKPDNWKWNSKQERRTSADVMSKGLNDRIQKLNDSYEKRAQSGEDAYILWKEHTHEAMKDLASSTGLKYERILPR